MALNDVWQLGLDPATLAQVGKLAENEAVGAPTGIMDQTASMLGRADHAVFLDCRSLDAELVELGFEAAGLELLVIDTTVKHSHATGGYRERRESCELGARLMGVESLRDLTVDDLDRARTVLDDVTFRRVRHVVTENQRVLDTVRTLREEGPRAIGPLLDASHASMRDDFEISVPELDLAVEIAQANGAIGARMTGVDSGVRRSRWFPWMLCRASRSRSTAPSPSTGSRNRSPSPSLRRTARRATAELPRHAFEPSANCAKWPPSDV